MNPKSLRQIGVIVLLASILAAAPPARLQERGMTVSAGRYFALVIGNDAYRNVPRLKTAEADAKSVEALLREKYGFQTRLLLNATREEIFAALNYYRHELNADASLLIYYAGHGYNDKDIDKAYWLPVDAKLDNSANWISADDITASVKAIPARHVLIISDSCYSGTLSRGISAEPPASSQRQQFLQKMMVGQSRTLMASGGNEPVADGGGGGHSVFAGALLRGLTQTDKGQFTAAELFRDYVEESVAGLADQTPEYSPLRNSGHESGDFVFVRVKASGEAAGEAVNAPATPATVDPAVVELAFWDAIKNSNDPEDYKEYLKKYPNGQFASLAERRAVSHARAASAGSPPDAPPDFTGTWVLDRGRTTDRSLLMGANTYNVTQDAQRIALASEAGKEGLRSRTTLPDATYRLDGTETTTEDPRERRGDKTSFRALWKDGGRTLELKQVYEFTYRGNSQARTETQDWALSADGKTLTIKRSIESSRGVESTVLILNKQ